MSRAEQIASTAVDEWDADDGLTIDMTLAEWVCHRLRDAGIDLDHTYERRPTVNRIGPDFGKVLYERRPLDGERGPVGVTWVRTEDSSWPIDDGTTAWSLRYQDRRYDAAALIDAYASLLDPHRTTQDAIHMLRRARLAARSRHLDGEG